MVGSGERGVAAV